EGGARRDDKAAPVVGEDRGQAGRFIVGAGILGGQGGIPGRRLQSRGCGGARRGCQEACRPAGPRAIPNSRTRSDTAAAQDRLREGRGNHGTAEAFDTRHYSRRKEGLGLSEASSTLLRNELGGSS